MEAILMHKVVSDTMENYILSLGTQKLSEKEAL